MNDQEFNPTVKREREEADAAAFLQRKIMNLVMAGVAKDEAEARLHPDYLALAAKLYANVDDHYRLRVERQIAEMQLKAAEAKSSSLPAVDSQPDCSVSQAILGHPLVKWIVGVVTAAAVIAGVVGSQIDKIKALFE